MKNNTEDSQGCGFTVQYLVSIAEWSRCLLRRASVINVSTASSRA